MELLRRSLGGGDGSFNEKDLETSRVLLFIFLVVIFVAALELALHHIERVCRKHHKYAKMLHKTTQGPFPSLVVSLTLVELMIVGLIYMVVKFCVYTKIAAAGGPVYYAMDAADLFVFFVTMALVFQSIVVFVRLRKSNMAMDKLSVMTAADLVAIGQKRMEEAKTRSWWTRHCVWRKYEDRMEMKLLGQFFLDVYKLPQLFSFAKYIREVQDSQIAKLIEVDLSTWMLLLGVLALYFVCTGELHATYRVDRNPSRLVIFGVFVCLLSVAMLGFYFYLKKLVTLLLQHATHRALEGSSATLNLANKQEFLFEAMNDVIDAETHENADIPADAAIQQMRDVAEELYHGKMRNDNWVKADLWCQLVGSAYRKCTGKSHTHKNSLRSKLMNERPINLPFFSRKACHVVMQSMLIANGFYYALMINCVLVVTGWDVLLIFLLLLPLLFNTFVLAPDIVRQFSILHGTWRVGRKKLSSVIEHFAQVEKMKQRMCVQIHCFFREQGKTIEDLQAALEAADAADSEANDGFIDIDVCREVLKDFGFLFARHKFNTFVRLEFDTKGETIKYADLLKILAHAPSPESISAFRHMQSMHH
ncbi:Aste57867_20923 [Aphanomyces stellatus]|uniref:Aste57867_20923 protein n=1 Tax=Aphanomyces stellatus TaxID=120398 RepID=A0A485LGT3_9STRA|nr:hypothetical protein As57867_020855 [Aphanomyces stellatus]VFT97600.1 Aste57867_20923 [Aphanomyces stellatus]